MGQIKNPPCREAGFPKKSSAASGDCASGVDDTSTLHNVNRPVPSFEQFKAALEKAAATPLPSEKRQNDELNVTTQVGGRGNLDGIDEALNVTTAVGGRANYPARESRVLTFTIEGHPASLAFLELALSKGGGGLLRYAIARAAEYAVKQVTGLTSARFTVTGGTVTK